MANFLAAQKTADYQTNRFLSSNTSTRLGVHRERKSDVLRLCSCTFLSLASRCAGCSRTLRVKRNIRGKVERLSPLFSLHFVKVSKFPSFFLTSFVLRSNFQSNTLENGAKDFHWKRTKVIRVKFSRRWTGEKSAPVANELGHIFESAIREAIRVSVDGYVSMGHTCARYVTSRYT